MKTNRSRMPKTPQRAAVSSLPMRIKSILVPLDFSPQSRSALRYALQFARGFKAKVTLLHVVEPVATPDFAMSFPLATDNDRQMAAARTELERLARAASRSRGLVEKALVRFGRSFHEIADTARTRKSDLIIISTHGYTGLKHALLGSTTELVVRHAPCPVLVLRQR